MGKRFFIIIFSGFLIGFFYTNCTPNQFSLKDQALLAEQQQQQSPPPTTDSTEPSIPVVSEKEDQSWLNWYGINWTGSPAESIRYAKQMGFENVVISYWALSQYKNDGLGHLMINPNYQAWEISDKVAHPFIDVAERNCDLTRADSKVTIANCSISSVGTYHSIEIFDAEDSFYNGTYSATQRSPTAYEFKLILSEQDNPALTSKVKMRIHYSEEEKAFLNAHMVWIDATKSFPYNLVASYYPDSTPNAARFRPQWDFQQQKVIDLVVNKMVEMFEEVDKSTGKFTGYLFDDPSLKGEMQKIVIKNGVSTKAMTTLYQIIGSTSSVLHKGISHEYSDYPSGTAVFFKQLLKKTKERLPKAKWGVEPYFIYNENSLKADGAQKYTSDWTSQVIGRDDRLEFVPDMVIQEGSGPQFMEEDRNFLNYPLKRNRTGTSQPNKVGESENRLYAGLAAKYGGWYWWFGRFGGTGDMPAFGSVTQVYPRLKLVRMVPHWDNLKNIPLEQRSWDGTEYHSPNSFMSSDIIYSRHWKTGKLFVVFNTHAGSVTLQSSEKVVSAKKANGYFEETGDDVFASDFDISADGKISLKTSVPINLDETRSNQIEGNAYIFSF